MLDETRKVYENDRQPDVLRHASRFFRTMSEDRYARVVAPLDGTDLQVERRDGVRLLPQLLSRGTAEQLYMAIRFALLRDYAGHVTRFPWYSTMSLSISIPSGHETRFMRSRN
jgi:uncharacterized protein YhaN